MLSFEIHPQGKADLKQAALLRLSKREVPALSRSESHPLRDSLDRLIAKSSEYQKLHGTPLPMLERRIEDIDQIAEAFGQPVRFECPLLTVVAGKRRAVIYGEDELVQLVHARVEAEFEGQISELSGWNTRG